MPKATGLLQNEQGMTIIEVLLVATVIAVVVVAVAPYLKTSHSIWEIGDRRSEVLQNARIGMDKMIREIRQAKSFSDVSDPTESNGYIEFIDKSDNSIKFLRYYEDTLEEYYLGYGPPGSPSMLAGPIDSLKFTCYQEDGVTETTTPDLIKAVQIEMTVSDSEGKVEPVVLSSGVSCRIDVISLTLVINEIMYDPSKSQGKDKEYEWVEFYNSTGVSIDVAGWQFRDGNQTDSILGDSAHGTGSTVIPAGGYAVITDTDTKVYDVGSPFSVHPNAIKLRVDDKNLGNGLGNNGDTITILNAVSDIIDSVTYDDSWGGDGNGRTLQRIDVEAPSDDPANWTEGPVNGTPGS